MNIQEKDKTFLEGFDFAVHLIFDYLKKELNEEFYESVIQEIKNEVELYKNGD